MPEPERKHDAAAVELAAGWIAICASCGWVGESYGSEERAAADCGRHIAEAPTAPRTVLAFLSDSPRRRGDSSTPAGAA